MPKSTDRKYKVAISYPSEHRHYIQQVADILAEALKRDSVFYDKFYEADLARPQMDEYLRKIYGSQAELVAPFFCSEYNRKEWCQLEWDAIRKALYAVAPERIMPFRFDNTEIIGFHRWDGYVPIGDRSPAQMAQLILERLSGMRIPDSDLIWEDKGKVKEFHGLPSTSGVFCGREDLLAKLDEAWVNPTTNICTLVASGGVGKTSLVKAWLERLQKNKDHGAHAIYSYSFYHQGALQEPETKEGKIGGVEFLVAALEWFGDADPSFGTAIHKAERLATLMQKRRTLLILDGLEPLQHHVDEFSGKLRDQSIQHLLRLLARANSGLCVITTRIPVVDLQEFKMDGKGRHVEVLLPNLLPEEGILLLRRMGADGDDEHMELAVKEVDGHALALTLLGSYLKNQFKGDIRRRDRLGPLLEEPEHGGHARRVMRSYEEALKEKPELNLLYILGLFDRSEKEEAVFAVLDRSTIRSRRSARRLWSALRNFPDAKWIKSVSYWLALKGRSLFRRLRRFRSIRQLTAPFGGTSRRAFDQALVTLRGLGLVNKVDDLQPDVIDCHPLVRHHFGEALGKLNPEGWQEAHSRLFEYYSACPKDEQPATLSEMQPLYAAVAHGCQAGRYTEAGLVYHRRMLRGAVYSCNHLGALQSDLALLTSFFDKTWSRPATALSEQEKSLLLHWSSTLLLTLGRYKEGIEPIAEAIKLAETSKSWWMASAGSYYLSVCHKTLGNLSGARGMARKSVEYANTSGDPYWLIGTYATLGHCLHQEGLFQEAKAAFEASEKAMCRVVPEIKMLHSVWSYWYCELLLDFGNFHEAKERGAYALKCAPEQPRASQGELLDNSVSELAIARAMFFAERQSGSSHLEESEQYFKKAFESLRSVNHQWLMPEALLARAEHHYWSGRYTQAAEDLQEIQALVERDGLKLHEADWRIASAMFSIHQKDTGAAHRHLDAAEEDIATMGYHRRDVQVLLLRAKLSHIENRMDDALNYLSMAKQKAITNGCQQWLLEIAESELLRVKDS
jgi:tetratricopeptide (TPR) repeat protein